VTAPPALSRGTVDRAALRRGDEAWVAATLAAPGAGVLVLSPGRGTGRRASGWLAPVADGPAGPDLVFVPHADAPPGERWLLGVDGDGRSYWATMGPPDPAAGRAADLWEVGARLSDRDAGLLTHAVALAQWHDRHPRCPRCGAPTVPIRAGAARRCEAEGSEHFPRSDPAVIMLVSDGADRCVLGRQAGWPQGRWSVLAGYVEPGESVEQAVAREVEEEVGLAVRDLRFVASQPWPFPSSLMLGWTAVATPDGREDLTSDPEELEASRWVDRAEVRAALAGDGGLRLPPPVSIAHRLLADWAAG
jgi:NADH pyrophosphatase NudC (nudix superfamily)